MRHFAISALLALGASCATSSPGLVTENPDDIIAVAEENARIGDQTFASQDPNAIRAAVAGACAHGCEALELRATPTAPYRAIRTVYDAAVSNGAARLQFRGTSALVPLMTGAEAAPEAACANEIVLRRDGIDVYVSGQVLEPQDGCAPWGATVCAPSPAEPTTEYQWASLRRVVARNAAAFAGPACLYARDDVPGSTIDLALASIAAETKNRTLFALRTQKAPGRLADERITAVVMENAAAFTACYDAEIEKKPVPMSVTMSFLIQTDGGVASARVIERRDTTPGFEACLTKAAEAMRFPAPDGGGAILINYPLSFTPRG